MLVQRDERPERERIKAIEQQGVGRTIALERLVRRKWLDAPGRNPVRRKPGPDLVHGSPPHQRLGLGEAVRNEQPVPIPEGVVATRGDDEVRGHEPCSLMEQLEERVLAVGARLAPHHRPGRVVDGRRFQGHALSVALHVELLQVGGKSIEALVVGEHRVGLGPEEVHVPYPEQGERHRHVPVERRIAKVEIHRMRPGEQLPKPRHARRDGDRQPGRGPQRVTPADPVPELEHVVGGDAELGHRRAVRRGGHEMPRHRGIVAQGFDQPPPRGMGVRHGLEGGEGLRRHHEQGAGGIEPREGRGQMRAVDVGDEVRSRSAGMERERTAYHAGAEIRSADADVDDVGDAPAGVAAPPSRTHRLREALHRIEFALDAGP